MFCTSRSADQSWNPGRVKSICNNVRSEPLHYIDYSFFTLSQIHCDNCKSSCFSLVSAYKLWAIEISFFLTLTHASLFWLPLLHPS